MSKHVYLIGCSLEGRVKIGTTGRLKGRFDAMKIASPLPLTMLWAYPGGHALENALHGRMRDYRIHGEWFDFGEVDPLETVISAIADELGLTPAEVRSVGVVNPLNPPLVPHQPEPLPDKPGRVIRIRIEDIWF